MSTDITKENISLLLDPTTAEAQIEREKAVRSYIQKYITEQLVEGKDYGTITITSKKTGRTTVTKPCLFKPGAEKFLSLLNLRAEFERDQETVEMLGVKGIVAYKCTLYSMKSDKKIAEGRGACSLAEKYNDANNTIKIAEKRAKVDAVLSLGLSDTFTQDLEDRPDNLPSNIKAAVVPNTPAHPKSTSFDDTPKFAEFTCPKCKASGRGEVKVWDNRKTKRNPKAPDFKCTQCDYVEWPTSYEQSVQNEKQEIYGDKATSKQIEAVKKGIEITSIALTDIIDVLVIDGTLTKRGVTKPESLFEKEAKAILEYLHTIADSMQTPPNNEDNPNAMI